MLRYCVALRKVALYIMYINCYTKKDISVVVECIVLHCIVLLFDVARCAAFIVRPKSGALSVVSVFNKV